MSHSPRQSDRLADFSRLTFSTRLWREVARKGGSAQLEDALNSASRELGMVNHSREDSLRTVQAWMLRNRRSDYIYRQSVISNSAGRSRLNAVRFSVELHLRSSVADLVRIGRNLEAFEIKSDRDNTSRLPNQLENAYIVSPYVSLVTTPANAENFLSRTPSTPVGVYTIGTRGGLRLLHRPRARWQRLETIELLNLLRAEERACALKDSVPNLLNEPNALQYRIAAESAAGMDPKDFYHRAVQALRMRPPTKLDPNLYYLYPILVSIGPNQNQLARMKTWLQEKV